MTKPPFEWDPAFLRPSRGAVSHSSWAAKMEMGHAYFATDWAEEAESFDLEQFPVIVANRLEQVLHWRRLEEQVTELTDRVTQAEEAIANTGSSIAVIQTFAPEKYALKQPISISIARDGEGYVASFFDANISTEGDNEQEAFENLKSLILDTFDSLSREATEKLGPEPLRQLAVLRSFISGS